MLTNSSAVSLVAMSSFSFGDPGFARVVDFDFFDRGELVKGFCGDLSYKVKFV